MYAQMTSRPIGPALGLPTGTTKSGLDPPVAGAADRLREERPAVETESFR
jgi:hypothetical protein